MDMNTIAAMVSVSVGISSIMGFVVSLMIRASISEATNAITHELHKLISSDYVRKDLYEMEVKEIRQTLKWLAEE